MGSEMCIRDSDITNPKSFESITKWKDEFLMQASPKDTSSFPFILIGNKVDKESERKVNATKAIQWCKLNGEIAFFEASAKDATNVSNIFEKMARDGLRNMKSNDIFTPLKQDPHIKLDSTQPGISKAQGNSGCKC